MHDVMFAVESSSSCKLDSMYIAAPLPPYRLLKFVFVILTNESYESRPIPFC